MYRYSQGRRQRKFSLNLAGLKHHAGNLFRHLRKAGLWKNLALLGLAMFLGGSILLLGMFAWYSRSLPDPDAILARNVSQSTKIYDRTGEHLLYEIAPEQKRTLVTIEQIPDYVEKATIAAEDRKFYEHPGIDLWGIIRAVTYNLTHLDPYGQGASTITQQFVKKAVLTDDEAYSRKIKEVVIAIALEKKFEKDEILQLYLNEIPYGGTNYGIESAAQAYFDKSVADVTLAEAATLAAIPNRPTTLVNNPDLLKSRRDWILDGMAEEGYVTQEEADAAKATDTPLSLSLHNLEAPHYVLWVKEQLEEKYGTRTTETGGLKVLTTLDYDKQKIAEEAITNGVAANGANYGFTSASMISVDPKTGQVLAMVGSPDYWNDDIDGQVNITLRPLQPGSSIKPIVYAAAFEKGYTPNTVLWDVNTTFPTATGPYEPKNYDLQEHGYVTMRKALQGSLNIPAVKALYLVGVDNALKFAQRLGYTTLNDPSKVGLSMVLGGAEVKMIDHAGAYATFANNGVRHDVVSILKVEDASGTVLEEWKAEEHPGEQVLTSNLAATISNVLADNGARAYVFGNSNYLTLGNRPVAAKTGTTNDYNDAWCMGYTPSLVAGVWVGNADGTEMKRGADGSKIAAPIWNEYMKRALKDAPVENFPTPEIPQTGKAVLDGKLAATTVTIDTASGKLATDRTPERFKETKSCGEYHTILHYVRREDPLGEPPKDPARADSYYTPWESAIQSYITRFNESRKPEEPKLESCEVPTEEDDVHTKRNEPSIRIENPDSGDRVGRSFEVNIDVELKRSFGRVDYSIDGTYIMTSSSTNGATISLPGWVEQGSHTLTAAIYDDVDNSAQDSISITVSDQGSAGSFRITNPFSGQVIEKTQNTYTIAVEVPNAGDFASIRVTSRNLWTGATTTVGETAAPSAITSLIWSLPEEAQYALTASGVTKNGQTLESMPIVVYVRDPSSDNGIPILENQVPLVLN